MKLPFNVPRANAIPHRGSESFMKLSSPFRLARDAALHSDFCFSASSSDSRRGLATIRLESSALDNNAEVVFSLVYRRV